MSQVLNRQILLQRHKDSSDTESNKKSIIIVSNANMGRYTCYVEHDGEVVKKSSLTYLD